MQHNLKEDNSFTETPIADSFKQFRKLDEELKINMNLKEAERSRILDWAFRVVKQALSNLCEVTLSKPVESSVAVESDGRITICLTVTPSTALVIDRPFLNQLTDTIAVEQGGHLRCSPTIERSEIGLKIKTIDCSLVIPAITEV